MPKLVPNAISRLKPGEPVRVVDFFAGQGRVSKNLLTRFGERVPVEYHPVDPNLRLSEGIFEGDESDYLPANFRVVPHRTRLPIANPVKQNAFFEQTLGRKPFHEVHAHMYDPRVGAVGNPEARAALLARVSSRMAPGATFYHTIDPVGSPFVSLPESEREALGETAHLTARAAYERDRSAIGKQLQASGLVLDQFIVYQGRRFVSTFGDKDDSHYKVLRALLTVTEGYQVPRILAFSAHKPLR